MHSEGLRSEGAFLVLNEQEMGCWLKKQNLFLKRKRPAAIMNATGRLATSVRSCGLGSHFPGGQILHLLFGELVDGNPHGGELQTRDFLINISRDRVHLLF